MHYNSGSLKYILSLNCTEYLILEYTQIWIENKSENKLHQFNFMRITFHTYYQF